VDSQGLPHALSVTTADVTDRKGLLQALQEAGPRPGRMQSLLCDAGHTGQPSGQGASTIPGEEVTVRIAKRSKLHTFEVMPRRWIVERGFAWVEKNRRLWKNCEQKRNAILQLFDL